MAVYIFMSLSIILGIALLLDFFGLFSRSKEKFDVEIENYTAESRGRRKSVNNTQVDFYEKNTRKAA